MDFYSFMGLLVSTSVLVSLTYLFILLAFTVGYKEVPTNGQVLIEVSARAVLFFLGIFCGVFSTYFIVKLVKLGWIYYN